MTPYGLWRGVLLAALVLDAAGAVSAHEVRPGLLELRESDASTYALLWKRPSGGEVEIRIAPVLPEGCRLVASDQQLTPGAVVVRGTLRCVGGLKGKTTRIAGLETMVTNVLARVQPCRWPRREEDRSLDGPLFLGDRVDGPVRRG